jgi:hypothetical protein
MTRKPDILNSKPDPNGALGSRRTPNRSTESGETNKKPKSPLGACTRAVALRAYDAKWCARIT